MEETYKPRHAAETAAAETAAADESDYLPRHTAPADTGVAPAVGRDESWIWE